MTRLAFDAQLEELNQKMIHMGMLCENAIRHSSESLLAHDMAQADMLSDLVDQIQQEDKEIENLCLRLLLRQQPVAKDLRYISSALKMVTDMNRIGVQSADIAEIVRMDRVESVPQNLPIGEMAGHVIHMVTISIDAFVKRSADLAHDVIQYDDKVDVCFDRVKKQLLELLRQPSGDPDLVEKNAAMMLDLLMIAKYLERIGDHAANIAQWVEYAVTGHREGT